VGSPLIEWLGINVEAYRSTISMSCSDLVEPSPLRCLRTCTLESVPAEYYVFQEQTYERLMLAGISPLAVEQVLHGGQVVRRHIGSSFADLRTRPVRYMARRGPRGA
jgi:hypothetical protein